MPNRGKLPEEVVNALHQTTSFIYSSSTSFSEAVLRLFLPHS